MEKEHIILLASVTSALATGFLAYLTYRYVKLTHNMVDEIKKSRNPLVFINFIEAVRGHYMTKIIMTISNKGLSSAKDIKMRVKYEHPFMQIETDKGNTTPVSLRLSELAIFRDGIPYLAPGKSISRRIGDINNKDIQKNPKMKISYSYKTELDETIYRDMTIDLRYLLKNDINLTGT